MRYTANDRGQCGVFVLKLNYLHQTIIIIAAAVVVGVFAIIIVCIDNR